MTMVDADLAVAADDRWYCSDSCFVESRDWDVQRQMRVETLKGL